MATLHHQAPPGSTPQAVEARLHAIHQEWEQERRALQHEEQGLLALHHHASYLRLLVGDRGCGRAPVLEEKLARLEGQRVLTARRIEDHQERCQELAAQFDVVQIALAVARRQTRTTGWHGSWQALPERCLHRLARRIRQALTWLAEQRGWEQGG